MKITAVAVLLASFCALVAPGSAGAATMRHRAMHRHMMMHHHMHMMSRGHMPASRNF